MTISVDYSQSPYLITIPKSDLTFVAGTEYNITVDFLWALLRDYADTEESLPYPVIYTNIPPTSSTPRIINFNDNYYVAQFEETSPLYAVEIINGNSNFRDVEVKNQISVGTNNTTGFINPTFLEDGLFDGAVTLDEVNGVAGTDYTGAGAIIGTSTTPSNNLIDAHVIAANRGFSAFRIKGTWTFTAACNIDDFEIVGINNASEVILASGASTSNTIFRRLTVQGVMDGSSVMEDCTVHANGITGVSATLDRCTLKGDMTLISASDTDLYDCRSGVPGTGHPSITSIGGAIDLGIRGYIGGLGIKGMEAGNVSLDMLSGHGKIYNTCIGGTIVMRGISQITDQSDGSVILKPDRISDIHTSSELSQNSLKGDKSLVRLGNTWYLRIYDTNSPRTLVLDKALKDSSGNDIDDIAAGALAQEQQSSV